MLTILGLICISHLLYQDVTASNLEALEKEYMNVIIKCMSENPLSPSEIENIQNKKMPESGPVKCLFACAFKNTGMMDDKGNLSIDGVREATKKYSEDPKLLQDSEDFINACKTVNDYPVSDGEKGCERAALIYKCSLEKAPEFKIV